MSPAACLHSCRASGKSSAPPQSWKAGWANDADIVPLYGMLDARAQDAAIRPAPEGRRKVVLATSIAETSITIDGVRVVVDSGLSRLPKFEPATGLTRLETVRVSRASAEQRAGRAGRTQPGVAIRLWRAEQTAALPAFTPPEILEADLSGLVLDCAAFGVADPASLAFLDPPPAPALAEAKSLLRTGCPYRRRKAHRKRHSHAQASRCRFVLPIWSPKPPGMATRAKQRRLPC